MNFCFVDYRTTVEELDNLKKFDLDIIKVPQCSKVYSAIDGHPDIQIHITDNKKLILQKDMPSFFLEELKKRNISYTFTEESLKNRYPKDIILNGISTKNYFIHNLSHTSKALFKEVSFKNLINVKQGYTKCSCAILGNKLVVTSDSGIYKELIKNDFEVLLLPPGDISLPGLNYGFIGGCCGMLPNNKIAFFGSLENYAYGKQMLNFLKKHNLEPIYLSNSSLIDRGSILIL